MPVKLAEKPSWYPIYFETPKKPDGDLLLSFQLIPVNELSANPKPSSLLPPTKDYTVEVSAIGIRNFRGLGPIPLNAPWMEFDTGGTVKVQSQKVRNCFVFLLRINFELNYYLKFSLCFF